MSRDHLGVLASADRNGAPFAGVGVPLQVDLLQSPSHSMCKPSSGRSVTSPLH